MISRNKWLDFCQEKWGDDGRSTDGNEAANYPNWEIAREMALLTELHLIRNALERLARERGGRR